MWTKPPADSLTIDLDSDSPRIVYRIQTSRLALGKGEMLSGHNRHFREKIITTEICLDLKQGTFQSEGIFEIGNFELLSANEWTGRKPIDVLSTGQKPTVLMTEPTLWDISAVNHATGARITPIQSHNRKDEMFVILNRINSILNYGRNTLDIWRDLIESGQSVPLEELRQVLRDSPPRFKFPPFAKDRRRGRDMSFVRRYVTPAGGHTLKHLLIAFGAVVAVALVGEQVAAYAAKNHYISKTLEGDGGSHIANATGFSCRFLRYGYKQFPSTSSNTFILARDIKVPITNRADPNFPEVVFERGALMRVAQPDMNTGHTTVAPVYGPIDDRGSFGQPRVMTRTIRAADQLPLVQPPC